MTENFVPFEGTLTFTAPTSGKGTLVLEKDNPSGLPEHADELRMPVKFNSELMSINVFLLPPDAAGPPNFDCSTVVASERKIPKTSAVARAAIVELLNGPTVAEQNAGLTSSLNTGVENQALTIDQGTARIDFTNRLQEGVGGSCKVAAIRAQITETLKQFPTVQNVVISIDGETEEILQP